MNALYQLAKADFLERVRRYSFLVTLAFAVYVGVAAAQGKISLRLGDYVGVRNSAWVGGLMSLTTTVFLSLIGFFIVSNSIRRDELTRVGQILAATPMSRFAYMLGKAISNFAVLSSMVAILAIAGVAIVLFGHTAPLEVWPLIAPFLIVALPAMALVAAVAVFFEATPVLRRISALAYFFFWIFILANATKSDSFDPIGMHVISGSMMDALKALDPTYEHAISFGFIVDGAGAPKHFRDFLWKGIAWTPGLILQHLMILPIAFGVALAPGLWFHRFDPAKQWIRRTRKSKNGDSALESVEASHVAPGNQVQPAELSIPERQGSLLAIYFNLVACELRLLAARRKWWAYAIVSGLVIAGFTTPIESARHELAAVIWLLPMFYWSRLGAREDLFATRSLTFSSPQAALRPLLAGWLAGACLPMIACIGILVRELFLGDLFSAASLAVGAFFVSALAMAVGNLARTPKAFEALYVVWWYIGPLQGLRGIDFVGVTAASAMPVQFAALTVLLILAAWGIREFRFRRA